MKIQKITFEHRNDFSAIMECEHCGNLHPISTGYHDNRYHTQVIPAMTCKQCGKNRAGEVPAEPNDDGRVPVPSRTS